MRDEESTSTERVSIRDLPKNVEAEQIILGSALLEPEATIPALLDRLKPEDFYRRAHRVIFRAIHELFDRGEPADIVAVANRLEEREEMERAGGRMYLNELLDRVTTTASLDYYAEIVRKKAVLRALVEAGGRISELGYDEERETDEVLDKAESVIFDVSRRDEKGQSYHLLNEFLFEHVEALEALHHDPNRRALKGFSTGFPKYDEMTSGLQRSDLTVVAGRPGTGKTSLALAIARHVAIREQASVGIFSLEMTKEQLLERLLCGEAMVSLHKLRGGYIQPSKWRDLANAASKFQKTRIVVDDTTSSILEIKAKARRMRSQHELAMLIVDYLQLVEGGLRTDVREQEVAYISRSLKKLARELDIPIIAVSQLNRAVEHRGDEKKYPRLADLRESGAIEQDADVVVFIYREDYYKQPDDEAAAGAQGAGVSAEIIIAKQRNGPLGRFPAVFHKEYASFYPEAGEERTPF